MVTGVFPTLYCEKSSTSSAVETPQRGSADGYRLMLGRVVSALSYRRDRLSKAYLRTQKQLADTRQLPLCATNLRKLAAPRSCPASTCRRLAAPASSPSYEVKQDLRPLLELQRPLIKTVESYWRFSPPKWAAARARPRIRLTSSRGCSVSFRRKSGPVCRDECRTAAPRPLPADSRARLRLALARSRVR
jgi:hypothetical protein